MIITIARSAKGSLKNITLMFRTLKEGPKGNIYLSLSSSGRAALLCTGFLILSISAVLSFAEIDRLGQLIEIWIYHKIFSAHFKIFCLKSSGGH